MPNIKLIAENFPTAYAGLNSTKNLSISRGHFMLASLTLGFQRFGDFFRSGFRTHCHRIGLGMSGLAYLEDQNNSWKLADEFADLDGSEKSTVSYWLGMVFAKLVADRHLNVPWLAHVDDMNSKGLLTTSLATKERGDFAGRDRAGAWHVIEAKGRSQRVEKGLLTKAKHQASLVASVAGGAPKTTSACITKLWRAPIEVLLDDPPQDESSEEAWKFKEESFWTYYYGSLASYVREFGFIERDDILPDYQMAPAFPFGAPIFPYPPRMMKQPFRNWSDFWIGLPKDIIESPSTANSYQNTPEAQKDKLEGDGVYIASDHTVLIIRGL